MADRILFLTGRLALPGLTRTLESITFEASEYEVRDLGLQVAGLMTASMIKRRLPEITDHDQVIVPGLCSGDLDALSEHYGIPVHRGPVDLKDLPEYFGQVAAQRSLDDYDIQIFAEIVDAPDLTVEQICDRAAYYQRHGADVIDLGCLPGRDFDHMEESIAALHEQGFAVSVDSMEEQELLRGGQAGADYILSLKESTLWLANEMESIPVLIPETGGDMASLYRVMDALTEQGRDFLADSILDPLNFGFTSSIARYHQLREDYPDAKIFVGTGNVTELTDADTLGMSALLIGVASELKASGILTTQVSEHARTVVAESDLARRVAYASRDDNSLPRGYTSRLMALHDKKPFPASDDEIREVAAAIRDPSFRIQVSDDGIYVYNRDGLRVYNNPFDHFEHLNVDDDGSHAFYLGVELSRAQIAWQLGKRYLQDKPLDWGVAAESIAFDEASHEYAAPGATLKRKKRDS